MIWNVLGWVANLSYIVGVILLGRKRKSGFLFGASGNFFYSAKSFVIFQSYDLVILCFVFAIIQMINWWKWRKEERAKKEGL